jgi:hypothetical protein
MHHFVITGSHLGLRPNQEELNGWACDKCCGEKCAYDVVLGKGEGKGYLGELNFVGRIV